MKKLLYAKDSEEFWQIFSEEREQNRRKQARLPFTKKIEILEKMKEETVWPRKPFAEKNIGIVSLWGQCSGRLAQLVKREMGFEPTTFCLGSRRSASELLPLFMDYKIWSI